LETASIFSVAKFSSVGLCCVEDCGKVRQWYPWSAQFQLDQCTRYLLTWVRLPRYALTPNWVGLCGNFASPDLLILLYFFLSFCVWVLLCVLFVGCLCDVMDMDGSLFRPSCSL
jgi:hypothetical protein